jgi:hypothetical protein
LTERVRDRIDAKRKPAPEPEGTEGSDPVDDAGPTAEELQGQDLARSMRRMRQRKVDSIYKSLVGGSGGGRVAEVVEASKELAQMVNVFSRFLADISTEVDMVRRDQHRTSTVMAKALNTVVKSQSAIAFGLERMVKSTASLAKSGAPSLQKSRSSGRSTRPTPGIVMNGKVIAEGNALRRSNAFVDETGSAVVYGGTVESRLTKSLVGTIIQQAVIDGEFSPTDALRWLTETDSPASGPVAVFRQLPKKLQERIASKASEEA